MIAKMRVGAGFVAGFATLLLAAPVSAHDEGVVVDQDSPAGKEYAIPLDEARRTAGGAPAPAPRFGTGIKRSATAAPRVASAAGGSDGDDPKVAGIAAGVLLLGTAVGLLLRGLLRPPSPT